MKQSQKPLKTKIFTSAASLKGWNQWVKYWYRFTKIFVVEATNEVGMSLNQLIIQVLVLLT